MALKHGENTVQVGERVTMAHRHGRYEPSDLPIGQMGYLFGWDRTPAPGAAGTVLGTYEDTPYGQLASVRFDPGTVRAPKKGFGVEGDPTRLLVPAGCLVTV